MTLSNRIRQAIGSYTTADKWSSNITLRDRASVVEVVNRYSTAKWARRLPKTQHDLDAPKVNANVFIATRAISDAIKSLDAHIVETEIINGVDREVINSDHPANVIIDNPNPEHSFSDITGFLTKAYLNDGNGLLTIERNTGPNLFLEIWPRDPRRVHISTNKTQYKFGGDSYISKIYSRDRVVHIRDMDTGDPFWGIGRINTIREEIMMDYFINRFNSGFFKNGATINLMFTPDHNLTDDQHMQILDAMNADIGGVENAFQIFINKYSGKYEYPDQKHKDIAFLELLKHNREKIFGVFGLPPFRGGVMEYANYANAVTQDKDFWINTVKPIIKTLEDAFNKQLIHPIFGSDVNLRFDLNNVPAIKGDQTEIEKRLIELKKNGIVSAAYVREQLNINEDAAPTPVQPPPPQNSDEEEPIQDEENNEDEPNREERNTIKSVVFRLYKTQRQEAIIGFSKLTNNGDFMSIICSPRTQVAQLFNTTKSFRSMCDSIKPVIRQIIIDRGMSMFNGSGVFNTQDKRLNSFIDRTVAFKIESIVDQNRILLISILEDADRYNWGHRQVERRIRWVFSQQKAFEIADKFLLDFINKAIPVLTDMKKRKCNSSVSVVDKLID